MLTSFVKRNILICVVLTLAAAFLLFKINKPFIGHHDWNGAFWGTRTQLYLNYFEKSPTSKLTIPIFSDYTPFMPLLFSGAATIFGLNETTLRLVPTLFSLLLILFIYKIGEVLYGKWQGLFAALIACLTPIFIYFGKLPDHEPIVTSLVAISFYFYIVSQKNKKKFKYFVLFLCLALLESWPAFFIIPPLVCYSIFVKKEKTIKSVLPFFLAIIVIALHLGTIAFFKSPSSIAEFIKQGFLRMNSAEVASTNSFTTLGFIKTELHYFAIYFSLPLLFVSFLWLCSFLAALLKKKFVTSDLMLLILFIYAFSFILVFRQLAYIHDYKIYHFLPFLALSASSFIFKLKIWSKPFLKIKAKTLNLLFILICLVFASRVFFERLNYLNTLLSTSFNKPGYDLATDINKKVGADQPILVNSNQFRAFYEVFVTYYSDRNIDYADITLADFLASPNYKKYQYIVLIDGRSVDENLNKYLLSTYNWEKITPFTFVNLKELK